MRFGDPPDIIVDQQAEIEQLQERNDELDAGLTAALAGLDSKASTIEDVARRLVTIRARVAGLRTCAIQHVEQEIGAIGTEIGTVINDISP